MDSTWQIEVKKSPGTGTETRLTMPRAAKHVETLLDFNFPQFRSCSRSRNNPSKVLGNILSNLDVTRKARTRSVQIPASSRMSRRVLGRHLPAIMMIGYGVWTHTSVTTHSHTAYAMTGNDENSCLFVNWDGGGRVRNSVSSIHS